MCGQEVTCFDSCDYAYEGDADVSEFAPVGPQAIGLRPEGTYKGRHVAFDSYATLRGRTFSDA